MNIAFSNITRPLKVSFARITPNYEMPATLLAKFLFLWTGKYDGDDLLSDIDSSVITVTGKDWLTKNIPPTTTATFAVPDNATYLAADGTDDWWFSGAGVLQQKTHADLIISETMRTFIKYSDFEPYDVSAIGILKDGEVLTEADKVSLNKFFKLWVQYWGPEMMASGYMKDNRTFIEFIDSFAGSWQCDEDGYGIYNLTCINDPVVENGILFNNFWDFAAPGEYVSFIISTDGSNTVTIPPQEYNTTGPPAIVVTIVGGSGTYDPITLKIDITITQIAYGSTQVSHMEFTKSP